MSQSTTFRAISVGLLAIVGALMGHDASTDTDRPIASLDVGPEPWPTKTEDPAMVTPWAPFWTPDPHRRPEPMTFAQSSSMGGRPCS